ncbi:hypothetical protein PG991_009283 [Apiospora marii]|uniref:RNase H type-1 domain-containing protein n=1 Tax=Apiospora marii TaxID=335849 RepID=A0ABR1RK66_9PEZI
MDDAPRAEPATQQGQGLNQEPPTVKSPDSDPNSEHNTPRLPSSSQCRDPVLSVFIQLGVLRLGDSRGTISTFDRHNEYVVAEATRFSPLHPSSGGETRPVLGGKTFSREDSVCEHVLVPARDIPGTTKEKPPSSTPPAIPVFTILDLAEHSRYQDCCHVRDAPYHRFYTGVPILGQPLKVVTMSEQSQIVPEAISDLSIHGWLFRRSREHTRAAASLCSFAPHTRSTKCYSWKLSPGFRIADTELTCIQKALQIARSWNAPCYIFTDSQVRSGRRKELAIWPGK